jgi:hypothetical protein
MPPRITAAHRLTLLGALTGQGGTRAWVGTVVKLAGSSLGVVLLIAAIVAYLLTLRPDIAGSRRLASNELRVLLEPGEQIAASAWVRRREWWDGFRETYGTMAVTDRRVLFVGIPPRELITPERRGPQPFVIQQLGRDESVRARRARLDFATAAGIIVENARGRLAFASSDSAGVDSVLTEISRGVRTDADAAELARHARTYEEQVTKRAVWHTVASGDALASVASRYGTTEADLIALNRLSGTTIKIGQRLLIKSGR